MIGKGLTKSASRQLSTSANKLIATGVRMLLAQGYTAKQIAAEIESGRLFKLRVRPAIPLPKHSTNRSARATGHVPEWDMCNAWLILGPPTKPGPLWKCDTDLVWPVLAIEGVRDFALLETPYVCRHQIVAGD